MNLASSKKSIGFIGAGIMGAALIRGLLSSSIKANQIYISEKKPERAAEVTSRFKVENLSLSQITQKCEIIFLSVKPQDLENVLKEISGSLKNDTLVISIAAGKTSKFIETLLESKNPVVRVMPNTPAQIGAAGFAVSHQRELMIADSPAAMADAIIQLLQEPAKCRALCSAARAFVSQKHDWSAILPALEAVYPAPRG